MRTPIHPGEILADELKEISLSANQLAGAIGVASNRLSQIIAGKRSITADTAIRLGLYFKMSPEFWMNLQIAYELDLARERSGKTTSFVLPMAAKKRSAGIKGKTGVRT